MTSSSTCAKRKFALFSLTLMGSATDLLSAEQNLHYKYLHPSSSSSCSCGNIVCRNLVVRKESYNRKGCLRAVVKAVARRTALKLLGGVSAFRFSSGCNRSRRRARKRVHHATASPESFPPPIGLPHRRSLPRPRPLLAVVASSRVSR